MAASLTAGMKMGQSAPTLAGKAGMLLGGIGLGAGAIIVKNVAGNISEDLGKKSAKFLPSGKDINDLAESMFQLSGNNALDLLTLIQNFQKLQLVFIVIILYNLLLLNINEDKIEKYLLKILTSKIVNIYLKSIRLLKKSGFLIIICVLLLLLLSNLHSYYYLNFFISNLDGIIDFYFKK